MRRFLLWTVTILALGLAAGAVLVRTYLPTLAEIGARRLARELGIPDATLRFDAIGVNQVVARDIRAGRDGAVTIDRLVLDVAWPSLTAPEFTRLGVAGLSVRASLDQQGLRLGGLEQLWAGAGGGDDTVPILPVREFQLDDIRLVLATAAGEVTLAFSGRVTQGDDGTLAGVLTRFTARHASGRVAGRVEGQLGPTGAIEVAVGLAGGEVHRDGRAIGITGGTLGTRLTLSEPLAAALNVALDLDLTRAGFAPLARGRLTLDRDADGGRFDLALADPTEGLRLRLRGTVPDPLAADPTLGLRAEIKVGDWAGLTLPWPVAMPESGRLRAEVTATARHSQWRQAAAAAVGPEPTIALAGLAALGPVGLRLRAVRIGHPLFPGRVDLDLVGDLVGRQGGISLTLAEPARLVARPVTGGLGPWLAAATGVALRDLAGQATVTLTGRPDTPVLDLGLGATGLLDLALDLGLTLDGLGARPAELEIAAVATLDPGAGEIGPWTLGRLELAAPLTLATRDLRLAIAELRADGRGAGDRADGSLTLALTVSGQVAGVALDGADLRFTGAVHHAGGILTIRPTGCVAVRPAAPRVAGWTLESGPVALCPGASGDLMRADFGADGLVDLDLRLADMRVRAWPPRTADRPPEPAITVAGLGGRLVATWSPDHGLGQVMARLGADRLEAPGQGLALKGVTARLASVLPPGEGTTDFRIAFASLDSALCAGCLSPLKGGVEATLTGDEVRFAGRLTDAGENAKLTFDGRHGLTAAEGDLTLRLSPWALRPDDGQIDAVAPVLLNWIRRAGGTLLGGADIRWRGAAGRAAVDLVAQRPQFELADAVVAGETVRGQADQVALSATAAWDTAGLESAGTLAIEGLTLAGFDVEMGQINGTVAFDRLWPLPPTTPPDQLVSLGYVQTVLPLRNGTLKFRLPAAGGIDVGDLSFDSLGGRVAIQGFHYRPGQRRIEVGLDVVGVELGRIFETAELTTMTGSAQIDGRIPIALEDGVLTVEAATLASRAGGRIGFLGEVPDLDLPVKVVEARSGAEALDVLRDFRFDHLGMSLTGSTAGDMELKAKLLGFNPTVYDGQLVDLDLTITGNLGDMLKAGRASYEIPDEIRKRMERFRR